MKRCLIILLATMLYATTANAQSYGNDVAEQKPGPYNFFYEKNGVVVYYSEVIMHGPSMNGKVMAACFKVVNNNNFPVIVTWTGPKWYSAGNYLDPSSNPGNFPNQLGYSDKYAPNETKDGMNHKQGSNGSEVYKYRPNWLYYEAPKQTWPNLSIKLTDFQVLNANGTPLNN